MICEAWRSMHSALARSACGVVQTERGEVAGVQERKGAEEQGRKGGRKEKKKKSPAKSTARWWKRSYGQTWTE